MSAGSQRRRPSRRRSNGLGALPAILIVGLTAILQALHPAAMADQKSGEDLVLSGFRVLPLDGYESIAHAAINAPVYPVGIRVSFELRHNGRGPASVNVHAMKLKLHSYQSGSQPLLSYRPTADKIYGAGKAPVNEFFVTLSGRVVNKARIIKNRETGELLKARSDNFLDTSTPINLTLRRDLDDIEPVRVNVVAHEGGLYEVSLVFEYSVGGVSNATTATETIFLYVEETE